MKQKMTSPLKKKLQTAVKKISAFTNMQKLVEGNK
jgi:hypothetical protein